MNKIVRFAKDKAFRIEALAKRGFFNGMSDEAFITMRYNSFFKTPLDLDNPQTLNQKLQWLKLHDRNPRYPDLVDKYEAKRVVGSIIGQDHIIPTYGVWDRIDDIDFDKLPDKFVIKTTHDCGTSVVCRDKASFDIEKYRPMLQKSLDGSYFIIGREWPYRDLKPRIIAEEYRLDDSSAPVEKQELSDYKFYCFDGYVDCVMICFDRASGDTKFYFFDDKWELLRINKRGKAAPADFTLPRPACLDEMFAIARELSKGIPFVRVDLYQSDNRVFFGEMTFYPQSGWDPNYLPESDLRFGRLIDLTKAYGYEGKSRN